MKRFLSDPTAVGSDIETCVKNLLALDKRQDTLFNTRISLIKELAYSICDGGTRTSEEIRQNYFAALSPSISPVSETQKYFDGISVFERIGICREISALSKKGLFTESVLGQNEPCPQSAKGRISYVKNNFTDSAYLAFSRSLQAPRCAYSDSFETICEDVFNGESEFCILPIETSVDGRLFSFYSLIDRYELKISGVCTVNHQGGSKFTRFALLCRTLGASEHLKLLSGKSTMLELRIAQSQADTAPFYDVFKAADACGMPLLRVDSRPLPYNDSLLSYYAVFEVSRSDLQAFFTYIALEFPQCYALGIYSSEK
jgi:prephenate dehydratase